MRCCRAGPMRETPGSISLPASEVTLAPGERAAVGTGLAVAIPEGHAGFVQPRSGLAARHGITIVNTPGLIDAGYRGEILVHPVEHRRERELHGRAGDADRAARRSSSFRRSSSSRWTRSRRASGRRAATGRPEADGREPRIRVSGRASLAGPAAAVQAREAGQGVLAAPGRRREVGREPGGRAPARAARGGRHRRQPRLRRANCDRRLDRSGEELRGSPRRAHHLRRRPDRPLARGRDVEGCRRPRPPSLRHPSELDELVLHPPIQRFLARWRSGDPIVYLGALWAP